MPSWKFAAATHQQVSAITQSNRTGHKACDEKRFFKKDLRKVLLKHQLVRTILSSTAAIHYREAVPRDLGRRQRDALVKRIWETATLVTTQGQPKHDYVFEITEKSDTTGLLSPPHFPNLPPLTPFRIRWPAPSSGPSGLRTHFQEWVRSCHNC